MREECMPDHYFKPDLELATNLLEETEITEAETEA
jgi:hypothetical protein